jgi:hypothetical protein
MALYARSGRYRNMRAIVLLLVALMVASGLSAAGEASADNGRILGIWEPESLNGANNNRAHPDWGKAFTNYPREAPANYADGVGAPVDGPNPRYISNRVFNDNDVEVYSERGVTQWATVWGQFLDHTFALRLGRRQTGEPGEPANFPQDNSDPMESHHNDLGEILMERSIPATGTGVTTPREQVNQVSSYIDADTVYGNDPARLDWMREGSVDGNPANNSARMMLPNNFLPRRNSRGNPDTAPSMVLGSLFNTPELAAVAGDQRANENPPLLATHTLFAREHNRIVAQLPRWMSEQDKFEIARAVVAAEEQYITYNDFLPALGVNLPRYNGYQRNVSADTTNEFATVGYRAHSFIRTDFYAEVNSGYYNQATLDQLRQLGFKITNVGNKVRLNMPIGEETFFNPALIETLGLGPVLQGSALRMQNNNDEMTNNLMRSTEFELTGNPGCAENPHGPNCAIGINDLPAVDIARGRDHGMPTYNQLRAAYGLPAKTSFEDLTGESSESFPADPLLTPGDEVNDPNSLDFTGLWDSRGRPTTPQADNATKSQRRTPLAARLKAIYGGDVSKVDAFVGMVAEPHVRGTEFGELQLAIWRKQFTDLRDGDRYFYGNDPMLTFVRYAFGIDYRKHLSDVIAANTDVSKNSLARNVFLMRDAQQRAAAAGPEQSPTGAGPQTRGQSGNVPLPDRPQQQGVLPQAASPAGRRKRR